MVSIPLLFILLFFCAKIGLKIRKNDHTSSNYIILSILGSMVLVGGLMNGSKLFINNDSMLAVIISIILLGLLTVSIWAAYMINEKNDKLKDKIEIALASVVPAIVDKPKEDKPKDKASVIYPKCKTPDPLQVYHKQFTSILPNFIGRH
jgi:hypothetical protein